eukprot:5971170-Karenia_brevis.AAC.1
MTLAHVFSRGPARTLMRPLLEHDAARSPCSSRSALQCLQHRPLERGTGHLSLLRVAIWKRSGVKAKALSEGMARSQAAAAPPLCDSNMARSGSVQVGLTMFSA